MDNQAGILYIVATPIGNLEDITLRALFVLKEVDIIACEDTRNTGKLLSHFDIKKTLVSYFQHSKLSKVDLIIDELKKGKKIALVTDAGTPGISDPGQALISAINSQKSGIEVIPIPGASALASAASVSGMIEKEFYFAGFLPKKKGRQTFFKNAAKFNCPIIIYESSLRLEKTLHDIQNYLGNNREVFIAREMTKMFEEYWGGSVDDVITCLKSHKIKGEVVLIVK